MAAKSRNDAWNLLTEFTKNDGLLKHGIAVEAAMRAYARRYGEPEEPWGIAGMLHDFDYELYPEVSQHAIIGARILEERGFPDDIVYAVKAHNDASGAPRIHLMDKVLFAVDELTGLITATALVRPTKSIFEVDAASVRRKMKDKAFARNVSRDDILRGAADLGVDLDEHIAFVVRAMQEQAEALGLKGTWTG